MAVEKDAELSVQFDADQRDLTAKDNAEDYDAVAAAMKGGSTNAASCTAGDQ